MVFVGTAREFRVADALARLHLRIADTYYDLGDFRAAEELSFRKKTTKSGKSHWTVVYSRICLEF